MPRAPEPPVPTVPDPFVVCDRTGSLDPRRLERAVELLSGGGRTGTPEPSSGPRRGAFVHLDLSEAGLDEGGPAEEAVLWVLRRCLGRDRETAFLVTYLDTGGGGGRLLLVGRDAEGVEEGTCRRMVDSLLALYGALDGAGSERGRAGGGGGGASA